MFPKLSFDEVCGTFRQSVLNSGLFFRPASSLIADDNTLHFINASVSPFKNDLANGGQISPFGLVQPCFRFRKSDRYMYHFNMAGLVAPISEQQDCVDVVLEFLNGLGFNFEQLFVVYGAPHSDYLKDSVQAFGSLHSMEIEEIHDVFATNWKFGTEELIGKGLTVALWLDNGERSLEGGGYLPLGNLVKIENSLGEQFLDFGFGVELLQSVGFGGSFENLPENNRIRSLLDNFLGESGFEMMRDALAIEFLTKHSVKLSNSGGGSVFKKCCYDLFRGAFLSAGNKGVAEPGLRNLVANLDLAERTSEIESLLERFFLNQMKNFNEVQARLVTKGLVDWSKVERETGLTEEYFQFLRGYYE